MNINDPLNDLTWWGCVLASFLPVTIVALLALPIGHRLSESRDDSAARGRLITLLASAFAFIVAFSTNTLWTQDLSIAESARSVGQSVGEMVEVVSETNPALLPQVESSLDDFFEDSRRNDLQAGLLESSTGVEDTFDQLSELLSQGSTSTADTAAAYETFHDNYDQYLRDLNSPSIPNVIVLVSVILGVGIAGVFASSPRSGHPINTRLMVALSVFTIGLYQFPLWVLNSRTLVLQAVHPYLSPSRATFDTPGTGFLSVVLLLVGVIVVLGLVLVLPGWLHRKKHVDELV